MIPAALVDRYGIVGRDVFDGVMALRPRPLVPELRARLEQAAALYAQSRRLFEVARTGTELTDEQAEDRALTALRVMEQARGIVEEVARAVAEPLPQAPAPAPAAAVVPAATAPAARRASSGGDAAAWVIGGVLVSWVLGRRRRKAAA